MGRKILYFIGRLNEKDILKEEFKIGLKRSVLERVRYGFIKTYKPVIDDVQYRIFNKIKDYKKWCDKYLPSWLGYGKSKCR